MEKLTDYTCSAFTAKLALKDAVPGGGGASAFVGALGAALGHMVGSLTVGKKKYADVEAEVLLLMDRAKSLQDELLKLVDDDAEAFLPLAKAYSMPKGEERDAVMEEALIIACGAPLRIMECCCEAIRLHEGFLRTGSRLAISDVGVGVELCKSALRGASLNVFINTSSMNKREIADELDSRALTMLSEYTIKADEIFSCVMHQIGH